MSKKKTGSASKEKIWAEFEALYGAWVDRDDIGDDWLDNLRASWDERLKELYRDELDDETTSVKQDE